MQNAFKLGELMGKKCNGETYCGPPGFLAQSFTVRRLSV